MSILDLSRRDQEIAQKTSPTEGTHLPGFYELHQNEIHMALLILATAVVGWMLWRYRRAFREVFIVAAAASIRMWRKITAGGRDLRSEIERRAK